MNEKEKMMNGYYYLLNDEQLVTEYNKTQELIYEYNLTRPKEVKRKEELLKQILGSIGKQVVMQTPIHIDYGSRTHIGNDFFSNYNLVMLDSGGIQIGNNVMFGPNVGLYTVKHPMDAYTRNKEYEIAKEIVIKDSVWLASNVIVLGGVTIGENSVIGAGSVVTKDIPANSFACGNPCKVIRSISQDEKTDLTKKW